MKGFWDGSCKDNEKGGCGLVVKGVDKENWVTISKIELPLRVHTAMAADMTGECLLIGVLNLILNRNLNVGSINRCIDGLVGTR